MRLEYLPKRLNPYQESPKEPNPMRDHLVNIDPRLATHYTDQVREVRIEGFLFFEYASKRELVLLYTLKG